MYTPFIEEKIKKLKVVLSKVGLNLKEIDVYACLCTMGPQPCSEMTKNTGIEPPIVSRCLNLLLQKELVYSYVKNEATYFCMEKIDETIAKLEQKAQLREIHDSLQSNPLHISSIPCFGCGEVSDNNMEYKEIQGQDDLKWLKMSILNRTSEILMYSYPEWNTGVVAIHDDNFWRQYYARIAARGIRMKIFIPRDATNTKELERLKQSGVKYEIRRISEELFPTPPGMEINILDNRIVVIENRFGIIFQNDTMVRIERAAFQCMWYLLQKNQA